MVDHHQSFERRFSNDLVLDNQILQNTETKQFAVKTLEIFEKKERFKV